MNRETTGVISPRRTNRTNLRSGRRFRLPSRHEVPRLGDKRDKEWLTNKQNSKNPDHPRKATAAHTATGRQARAAKAEVQDLTEVQVDVQAAKAADQAVIGDAAVRAAIAAWKAPPKSISTN